MKNLIILMTLAGSITAQAEVDEFMMIEPSEDQLIESVKAEIPQWDKKTQKRVDKYAPIIIGVAKSLKMDAKILLSVAWTESHFNPRAVSYAGAKGIMQVKDDTKEYIFKKYPEHRQAFTYELANCPDYEILENIIAGALYVHYLIGKYDGDTKRAIVAYNEGPTGTYRLIKRNYDLDNHQYYQKVSEKIETIHLETQQMIAGF